MGQEEETLNNKEGKVAVKHPRKKDPEVSSLNETSLASRDMERSQERCEKRH